MVNAFYNVYEQMYNDHDFFEMYDKQIQAKYSKEYILLIATSSDTHKSCLFYIKTENKI